MAAFSVLGGSLTLFDGPDGYRPSEDSFWLAALAPPTKGAVCDLGCGTGAVGLGYLTTHRNTQNLWGFDVQPEMVHAANKAATYNGLNAHFKVGDIAAPPFASGSFALTLANPPFYNPEREMPPTNKMTKQIKFTNTPLTNWLDAMNSLTMPQGFMALVVCAKDSHALIKKAHTLGCSLEGLLLLKTQPDKAPKRAVLIFRKEEHATAENKVKEQVIATYKKPLREKYLGERA